MVYGYPYYRQSQSNIYSGYRFPVFSFAIIHKSHYFERDVSLIVIHGNYDIIPSAPCFGKNSVRRNRSFRIYSFLFCSSYRRSYLIYLFCAEHTVLSAVRIESGYPYNRFFYPEIDTCLIGEPDNFQNTVFFDQITCLAQRDMC